MVNEIEDSMNEEDYPQLNKKKDKKEDGSEKEQPLVKLTGYNKKKDEKFIRELNEHADQRYEKKLSNIFSDLKVPEFIRDFFDGAYQKETRIVRDQYLREKIKTSNIQELDESGNAVMSDFLANMKKLRSTPPTYNGIFSKEKTDLFLKQWEKIDKTVPFSPVVYNVEKCLRTGEPLNYSEVPQLYNDKEGIIFTNLIQPTCPEVSHEFKLRNNVDVYMEASSIQAQNDLRREDIEFKGFWTSFFCFFLTLFNHKTTIIIPILVYEYGFHYLWYIMILQIIICYPILVFVISLSQYSGLGYTRVFSRIKRVWRGIEYAVMIRSLYSLLVLIQEVQFYSQLFLIFFYKTMNNHNFIESCYSTDNGCVNIGYIHSCLTGFDINIPNNKNCRIINQVSMEKYIAKTTQTKIISLMQYLYIIFTLVS
uniref:Transmembrane protein n=1 Tax=Parastrongyloides trichosuri TaxID=131310 RepID=A0A0N4Z5X6_PARTI